MPASRLSTALKANIRRRCQLWAQPYECTRRKNSPFLRRACWPWVTRVGSPPAPAGQHTLDCAGIELLGVPDLTGFVDLLPGQAEIGGWSLMFPPGT